MPAAFPSFTLYLALAFALVAGACGTPQSPAPERSADQVSAADGDPSSGAAALPRLPADVLQTLIDSADYVDYLFYDYAFSMSMDNPSSVKYAVAKIGPNAGAPKPECKPIGRVFYQIRGRNYAEADLYFTPGCAYLLFMVDGEPTYVNDVSDVGKEFLNNQLSQVVDNFTAVE